MTKLSLFSFRNFHLSSLLLLCVCLLTFYVFNINKKTDIMPGTLLTSRLCFIFKYLCMFGIMNIVFFSEGGMRGSFSLVQSIFAANIVILLMKMAMVVCKTLINIYIYRTSCDHLYHREPELCLLPEQQMEIGHLAAFYILLQKITLNFPAFVIGPFFGKCTDDIGRKLPSLIPVCGNVIGLFVYILASTFLSRHALCLILIGSLIRGISGKSGFVVTALQSYIVDICPRDKLTSGLGSFIAMSLWGVSVGLVGTGILLELTSFSTIFCILIAFMFVCVILILLFINDVPKEEVLLPKQESFNLFTSLQAPFIVMFRRRSGYKRFHLLVFLILTFIYQTCRVGEEDVLLLYLQKLELSTRDATYAYLLGTGYALQGMCLISVLPLCLNIFHISDNLMILLALMCKVFGLCVLAFSHSVWMLYSGVIIGAPSAIFVTISKSIISKLVLQEEIGLLFGLVTSLEILSSISGSGIFIYTYLMTSEFHRGTTYLLMAGVICMMIVMVLVLLYLSKLSEEEKTLKDAINNVKKYDHEKVIEEQLNDITRREE